jgi:putative transcriptional regulator
MNLQAEYLTDQLLIAMPGLEDPWFSRSVIYVCQHNEEGALGITVNRPSTLKLSDIFEQLGLDCRDTMLGESPVFLGGPVHPDRGFVLHGAGLEWDSTLKVSDRMFLTSSRDILEAIGKGLGPQRFLVALGYSGWGKAQLESEIVENSWLNANAEEHLIFSVPVADRWHSAANLMGVDISLLPSQAGHG